MIQSPLRITLPQATLIGVLFGCLLLNGCVTFTGLSRTEVGDRRVAASRWWSGRGDSDLPSTASRDGFGSPLSVVWSTVATTAAGEPLQTISIDSGRFRTLVVGSVGGHDSAAVKLTDDLARYIHHNHQVVGGVNLTVLRTLNPHGMLHGRHENSDGVYLNRMFPKNGKHDVTTDLNRLPAEVRFLIDLVADQRPHRIIHIRTVRGSGGMLAVSHGALDSGLEVADWLGFTVRNLPEGVRAGTLEAWAANRGDCDVIMMGVPRETEPDHVWTLYGDALLSLLLDGDTESRRMVREENRRRSAERRLYRRKTSDGWFGEMFRKNH